MLLYLSLPVPPYPWIPAASGEGRGTLLISGSAQRMPCCCSLLLRSGGGSKGTTTTAPPPPKKKDSFSGGAGEREIKISRRDR